MFVKSWEYEHFLKDILFFERHLSIPEQIQFVLVQFYVEVTD